MAADRIFAAQQRKQLSVTIGFGQLPDLRSAGARKRCNQQLLSDAECSLYALWFNAFYSRITKHFSPIVAATRIHSARSKETGKSNI
jgi:hypothetical protein